MTLTHLYLCECCDAVVAEGETHGLRVVNVPVAGTSGVGDAPCPRWSTPRCLAHLLSSACTSGGPVQRRPNSPHKGPAAS
jgi:hypothetical protein